MTATKSTYEGGCHCGAVRIELETTLDRVLACNCSICTKKGFLHVIEDRAQFRVLAGEDALTDYQFGTHAAHHLFCSRCGIAAFYYPRSHPGGVSVNARCLDGVDLAQLQIEPFDGQNWEASVDEIR